ncbi:MAG TPA: tRNA (adenosine(37)-N6)-threonylcarbamoyltransferase complex ATPase subunit type 1 TsaE [Chloroflexota bacterium]|nr:tRNA (adenosine(37)-N6)-threonylcarbamoyltransferase complex ATPase subunit type 1 TsaE [Chloroflexota bacterium]
MSARPRNDLTFRTSSAGETQKIGEVLGKLLRPHDIVRLEGTFGAGKTTLAQGIARGLGISENVTSPSFALVNEYPARPGSNQPSLYHLDLYRLSDSTDVESLGLEDYMVAEGVLVVEWGRHVAGELPEDSIVVDIRVEGDNRVISLSASNQRGAQLLEALAGGASDG